MKSKYYFFLSTTLAFLLFSVRTNAQLTPQEANALMSRGINIGNTLETPTTEGSWGNGPAKEYYFDDYKSAGFTNVRIPVKWDQYTSMTSPYTINPSWLARVEQIVDWGLERGFIITINAHHDDWIKENYSDPLMRARFDSIWSQVSTTFKDKSDKLLFEMINEPKGLTQDEINDLNARILSIIRKTNPTRIVIYSGHEWAASAQLMSANIPDDDYILGYYHSYSPWNFAGEAIGTWGTPAEYSALESSFANVKTWSQANGIPVTISEFGAMEDCDYNSRMRFYAAYTDLSLKYGLSFSVWDDGGWFQMYLRSSRKWNDLKDIVINTTHQSPTTLDLNVYNDSLVKLSWTNRLSNYDSIVIERKTEYTQFERIASVAKGVSEFIDPNVSNNKFYYYRLIVHLSDESVLHSYPIRIFFIETETGAFNGTPAIIPGIVEAENYDKGGAGVAYYDTDEVNVPGAYRTDEGVDIEARPESGFQLTGETSGEWLKYTINVTQAGNYLINYHVATEETNGIFYLEFRNGTPRNVRVPVTANWFDLTTVTNNFYLEEGLQEMTLHVLGYTPFSLDKIEFISDPNAIENDKTKSLQVYPNPTSDYLQISSEKGIVSSIIVYNSFGQEVYNMKNVTENLSLPVQNYKSGVYFIEAEIDNVKYYSRFIKN